MLGRVLEAGRKLMGESEVEACGIGFGGPVDFETQRVISSTHVAGWEDVPLATIVGRELKLPTILENDANAGGLGEFVYGAGRGCRNLVYLTISTGIGGGIILDGGIFRGSDGNAGEWGHVPVMADGPGCDCGNRGCLEAVCSGKSIGRRAEEAVCQHPRRGKFILDLAAGEEITAKVVFSAARQGDRLAREIVEETCTFLGMGIAAVVNGLAPDRVVIGGGVARAGGGLFEPLRIHAARFTMPVHRPHLCIVPARRGGNSVLMGGVSLAKKLL